MAELKAWEEAPALNEESDVRWEWRPNVAEKEEGDETDNPVYLDTGQLVRMTRDENGTWQFNETFGYCDFDAAETVIADANGGVPLNEADS